MDTLLLQGNSSMMSIVLLEKNPSKPIEPVESNRKRHREDGGLQ
jgi:hypothetical protein